MRQRPPCRPPSPFLPVPSSAPPADMFENTVHRFPDPNLGSPGEAGTWSQAPHLAHPTRAWRLRGSCRGLAVLGLLASPSLGRDPSSLFSSLCSRTIWGRPPASWRDLGTTAGGLCRLPAARPWHMPPHPSLGFLICKMGPDPRATRAVSSCVSPILSGPYELLSPGDLVVIHSFTPLLIHSLIPAHAPQARAPSALS